MATNDATPFHLTQREQEILRLICEGHSTKQIAYLLGVSHKTISCHRGRILAKARVHDTISLFRWALENGHVSLFAAPGATKEAGSGFSIENRRKPPSTEHDSREGAYGSTCMSGGHYENGEFPIAVSQAAGAHR
jgi:DNA-binding CsgD family transcriptional regulator